MSNMDKNILSVDDICRILKQCQDTGVTKFCFGDLVIKFLPHRNEDAEIPGQVADSDQAVTPITQINKHDSEKLADQIDFFNQELFDDANTAQLMIDDPVAFEKIAIDRDIERNRQLA